MGTIQDMIVKQGPILFLLFIIIKMTTMNFS